ncbi:MAG: hypothetical protein LBQ91_02400, partial [Oscillospiraceae bacterium]|nr:hypothetical protein [Oscillospiraceae bacterium]
MTRKKAAVWLAAAVFLCVLCAIIVSRAEKKGGFAEIYVDSRLLYTINLSEDAEFTVPGYLPGSENTVLVENGRLRVID